eukprot:758002-Hanusia_phi.AAC.1
MPPPLFPCLLSSHASHVVTLTINSAAGIPPGVVTDFSLETLVTTRKSANQPNLMMSGMLDRNGAEEASTKLAGRRLLLAGPQLRQASMLT